VDINPGRIVRRALAGGVIVLAVTLAGPISASADVQMAVPVLSQWDGRWASTGLGSSHLWSIGNAGCAITAVVMMLDYYGLETDPAQLNAWLTGNGGYAFGDELIWDQVTAASGGRVAFTGWFGPALGQIDSELDEGHPVIAQVVLNRSTHFVLITGYTDAGYLVNDPWFGDSINFSERYGDPAAGIVSIRTFAPPSTGVFRGPGMPRANSSVASHRSQ
jgi:hypothetical protein